VAVLKAVLPGFPGGQGGGNEDVNPNQGGQQGARSKEAAGPSVVIVEVGTSRQGPRPSVEDMIGLTMHRTRCPTTSLQK